MKGYIRQRSKGSWEVAIDVGRDPSTGKRQQHWETIRGTKRDAERRMNELLHSLTVGTYVKPRRLTLTEYLEQWLNSYVLTHCSPRTTEGYQTIIRRYLIPALGAIPLTELQPQHLQNYCANALAYGRLDKKGGLSSQSVLNHYRVLHKALEDAVRQGLVGRNIVQALDPPRPLERRMSILAPENVPMFLKTARKTSYYVLYYTALYTGMRRG